MAYWDYTMQDGYLAPTAESVSTDFNGFSRNSRGLAYNNSVWNFTADYEGYPFVADTKYTSFFGGEAEYIEDSEGTIHALADIAARADIEEIKDGYIPNEGNTTTDDLEIKRDFIKLANNETNESYIGITDTNGGQVFIAGQNRTHIDGGSADIDLHDYIQLRAGAGQKAYYGNPQSLTDDYEIAVKGDLTGKLDKTGGAVTGQITTNQTTFDNDQQLVTKKYVDDNAGGGGSAYTETVLWTNTNMTSGYNIPFTLSSAANLFDTIIYYLALTSNGVIETHMPVYCPAGLVTDKISAEYNNNRFFDGVINAQYTGGEFSASGDCTLHKIIGINYGEHVANFEEEVFPNG